jgi:cation:H+ antiporter
MLDSLPLLLLILIFLVGSVVIWYAGIQLSNTTDILASRFHFGEALGGIIFLAFATNLPEIAITASAALTNNIGIAIGNILGGIALQTVVLVALDVFGLWSSDALTYQAASLQLVLEGILVIAVLTVSIMSTLLPASVIFLRITPGSLFITILWLVGILLLQKARKGLPWQDKGLAPDRIETNSVKKAIANEEKLEKQSTTRTIIIFVIASIVTLIAGVALEESSNAIAKDIGLNSVVFAATFLAAATSLPELSTGLQAVKIRAYDLAMSDIFGGNTFLPVLFLVADLLSGKATLPHAQHTDVYLAGLGILLTTVYLCGLIFRPKRQIFRMGIDSLVVLIFYMLGIVGLIAVAQGK